MRQDRHGSLLRHPIRNQFALSHRRNRARRISAELRDRVFSNCVNSTMSIENPRSAIAATKMKIREAVESDLPAIIDIYNAAVATRVATAQLEPVTLEDRRDWLKEHSPNRHPFLVLEIDGHIAGWLTLKSFLPRCAYRGTAELSVYVDEKFRRRGIAKRLIEEAIARAPS